MRPPIPDDSAPDVRPPLSGTEAGRAEAFARYSQFLLLQADQPESPRLPDILRRAVLADPAMPAFHIWLGQAYLTRGRAAEAIPGLEEAVRRYPDSDVLLYMLGLAYEGCERFPEAKRAYQALQTRSPRQTESYLRLASLALRDDRNEAAFAILDEAFAKVDEPLGVMQFYEALGEQYLTAGKAWLAVICFTRLSDHDPRNSPIRERLMKSRLLAGDRTGAIRELKILAEQNPDTARWPLILGEMAEEDRNEEEAGAYYEKAVKLPDAGFSAWIRLALHQSRSSPKAGLDTLKEAAVRYPDDPQPLVAAGAILYNLRRPADAVKAFDLAEERLKAAPSGKAIGFLSPYYYFWYGAACDESGHPGKAEPLLLRSITLFPDVPEAHNYLAYLWAQKNVNLDKALDYARYAVKRQPDSAAFQDTLGWVLYRQGKLAEALAVVSAAAKQEDDSEIALHMGDILEALGRRTEALTWWRKSAALEPGGTARERLSKAGAEP